MDKKKILDFKVSVMFATNLNRIYSGLHKNWPLTNFQKIGVAVGWVNIKVWSIPHLKSFTATFKPM